MSGSTIVQCNDSDVNCAVVIEISERSSPVGLHGLKTRAGKSSDVLKSLLAVVKVELVLLPVGYFEAVVIYLRENVTVCHEEVLEPVIVEIEEPRSPF